MDFEDSGIESDPKINTEKETLQQHNEPIISFSPERCRFDSAQSSSRKSSTSFPISVADLQLDEHIPSSLANNNCNSINNLQNLSKTTINGVPSKTTSIHQLDDHALNNQHQPLFTNLLSKQQQQLKQAFPFFHNQQQQLPQAPPPLSATYSLNSSKSLQGPTGALAISTHALSSTTSAITSSSNTQNRATTFLPSQSSLDSPSISLMVNGAVLSANNNNSTNTTPTSTSTATTLDLQKRLEKRIAQASAIAAAAAAAASSSSTSTTTTTTSSTSLSSTAAETKGNESILLSDIISATGIANKAITIPPSASTPNIAATATSNSSGKSNGNQISFSPQKSYFFSAVATTSEQLGFQEKAMLSSSPSSLWESDPSSSSAIDLWENKVAPPVIDGFPGKKESVEADSFMDVSQTSQVHTSHSHQSTASPVNDVITGEEKSVETVGGASTGDGGNAQLDLTCKSGATTSCTSTSGSGGVAASTCSDGGGSTSSKNNSNVTSVNKSSSSKNNNKPKGNQSLRNNNNTTTSNVPGGGAASSSSSAACSGGSGGGSVPPEGLSSSSPSVITVVNASFDIRKVSALLPPQRLAIPSKSNPQFQSSHSANSSKTQRTGGSSSNSSSLSTTNNSTNSGAATVNFSSFGTNSNNSGANNPPSHSTPASSSSSVPATVHKTSTGRLGSISETSCGGVIQPPSGNGNIKMGSSSLSKLSTTDSEKKPLVQWDSDESEEELSFFPPSKRGSLLTT